MPGWRGSSNRIHLIATVIGVVIFALLVAIGARAMGPTTQIAAHGKQLRETDFGNVGSPAPFQEMMTTTPVGTSTATPAVLPEGTITETPTGTTTVTAIGTGTPDPSLEVSVISVKVEKKGSRADWTLSRGSIKKAAAKSTVRLSIYYSTASTKQTDGVKDQWTVTKNRKVIFRKSRSHALGRATADLHRDYVPFKVGKVGTYVYTGRVTVRGVSDAGRTSIRVLKRAGGKRRR